MTSAAPPLHSSESESTPRVVTLRARSNSHMSCDPTVESAVSHGARLRRKGEVSPRGAELAHVQQQVPLTCVLQRACQRYLLHVRAPKQIVHAWCPAT